MLNRGVAANAHSQPPPADQPAAVARLAFSLSSAGLQPSTGWRWRALALASSMAPAQDTRRGSDPAVNVSCRTDPSRARSSRHSTDPTCLWPAAAVDARAN